MVYRRYVSRPVVLPLLSRISGNLILDPTLLFILTLPFLYCVSWRVITVLVGCVRRDRSDVHTSRSTRAECPHCICASARSVEYCMYIVPLAACRYDQRRRQDEVNTEKSESDVRVPACSVRVVDVERSTAMVTANSSSAQSSVGVRCQGP